MYWRDLTLPDATVPCFKTGAFSPWYCEGRLSLSSSLWGIFLPFPKPIGLHASEMCSLPAFASALLATSALSEITYIAGYYPGINTVIFTTPYTYAQVMPIIGSFRNITWSGSPYNTVSLNGTDDTVGTARTCYILGAYVVETITFYSKPPNGPYQEIHTLNGPSAAPVNIPSYNN